MAGNPHNRSHWSSLPPEIRNMILEIVSREKHPGWASLASISEEWQLFIEKRNFSRLKLRAASLDSFAWLASRKRELVRHIVLDVQLPKPKCPCHDFWSSYMWLSHENRVIRRDILKLYSILSTWQPVQDLTLELTISSPKTRNFRPHAQPSAPTGHVGNGDATSDHASGPHTPHGFMRCARFSRLLDIEALHRHFQTDLPQVSAVTSFVMRRKLRRRLSPTILGDMLEKLCRLEHVTYEPWRRRQCLDRRVTDDALQSVFQDHLPASIKTFSAFEDFHDSQVMPRCGIHHIDPKTADARVVNAQVSAALACKSLDLEELAVSYMMNAENFFQACARDWTWHRLESLALTSQLLVSNGHEHRQDVYALLHDAGTAALRMPRLRKMAIWNGTKHNACAFIFHSDTHHGHITWRGTWDLELIPSVVEIWDDVASRLSLLELWVHKEHIERNWIASHGDAIHHLRLPCQVVDPKSLRQMRMKRRRV